jgi:energy-coupling factor transporter ATP-binding protein EcfA2
MRLRSVELKNFKRFTNLQIDKIPDDARLVLMIGANGSGKSSVFDAFEFLTRGSRRGNFLQDNSYYRKIESEVSSVVVETTEGAHLSRKGDETPGHGDLNKFYGRSSMRVVPTNEQVRADASLIARDFDAPDQFIQPDVRFNADVQLYTAEIDRLLREPVFAGQDVNPREIFTTQVQPLNEALLRVFGDDPAIAIQLAQFQSAESGKAPVLEFRKGSSRISYDVLSHGEKQVVVLLLNFMVRREHLQDKVVFIDEMDGHLHRSLQYRLLEEIVEHWVPESSQLWTATHALGFIEYAITSKNAAVLDFDELDFDQAHTITPTEKSRPEVFDIAIDRDLIAKLSTLRRIVLVEGKDQRFLRHCKFDPPVLFSRADNKQAAFVRAEQLKDEGVTCLVDQDYVTEEERTELLKRHGFLRMLQTYCIENELYHPDNVYEAIGSSFDRDRYVAAWQQELVQHRNDILGNINAVRQTYGFYFADPNERKKFIHSGAAIVTRLQSDAFDDFYAYFSAKTYGSTAKAMISIGQEELAKTIRFADRIRFALAP